ncbi:MAG: hypothetical protein IH944_13300, partial [Armatimonadetes bacterium]|nr:hypothetical protein [Armatimonadota bacterium]
MALLAYNKTGSPLVIASTSPAVTLSLSLLPPARGPATNVTSELRPNLAIDPINGVVGGIDVAGYTAIQVQVAAKELELEWTADPEYVVAGGLVIGGPLDPTSATKTIAPLDLFVSGLNGDDSNDGLSPSSPFATLTKAESVLPDVIAHRVIIHAGNAGGSPYAAPLFKERVIQARVWVIGDGAGQPGEDGFVAVAGTGNSGTADGASSNSGLVFGPGGMVADAFRGKTLEITSGPAVGDRRTITENDGTIFRPARRFSASPAGSTYRVIEPDVEIDILRTDPIQVGVGIATGFGKDGSFRNHPDLVGLFLVNLRLGNSGPTVFASFHRSRIQMHGVEIDDVALAVFFDQTLVSFGTDADAAGATSARDDFSLPSNTSWFGWGLTKPLAVASTLSPIFSGDFSRLGGFVVLNRIFLSNNAALGLRGGRLFGDASGAPSLDLRQGARASLVNLSAGLLLRVDKSASGIAIRVRDGSLLTSTGRLDVNADAGTAIQCRRGGVVVISGTFDVTIDSTSGFGIDASRGGKVFFGNFVPPVTGGAGDLTVDGLNSAPSCP